MVEAQRVHSPEQRFGINLHWSIRWGVGLAVGLILWFVHLPGLAAKPEHGFALIIATMLWWVLGAAAPGLIGILFTAAAILFGLGAGPKILALAWTSSNMWFVFASFGFGMVVAESGLGERITYTILKGFSRSYWMFGFFIIISGALLSFIGMAGDFGRMSIIFPLIVLLGTVAGASGKLQSTKPMAMLLLASGIPTTMYFFNGFWLNATFLGLAHQHVDYVQWIELFLVPSLMASLLGLVAVRLLFPGYISIPPEVTRAKLKELGPLSAKEKKILGFFLLAVVLWGTSVWTHLDSGWIAIGVFALMMIPEFGIVRFDEFVHRVNWNVVFFLSGAFALGGLVGSLGLAKWIGHLILPTHFPHNPYLFGIVVSVLSMVIHLFTGDVASAMAVTVPVFEHAAVTFHFNPLIFAFTAYMSLLTQYFFLFQEAALVFAFAWGLFTQRDVLKLGIAQFIYTPIAVGLLSVFYWHLIGVLY
jgi:di/tricarboxylate transporter